MKLASAEAQPEFSEGGEGYGNSSYDYQKSIAGGKHPSSARLCKVRFGLGTLADPALAEQFWKGPKVLTGRI